MSFRTHQEVREDHMYQEQIARIVGNEPIRSQRMSQILDHLYLGDLEDSSNLNTLKQKRITHIINCAAGYCTKPQGYYDDFTYIEFSAEDDSRYDIMQHYDETFRFIESARNSGGKVLIHCIMGINRSAALTVAYVMAHRNLGPISAVRLVQQAGGVILANEHFQDAVVSFARQMQLLELDKHLVPGLN